MDTTYPEKYWHCRVVVDGGSKKNTAAVVNDLSFGQLDLQIIRPWKDGKPFTVSGLLVPSRSQVRAIRIVQTDRHQQYYANQHDERMRASNIVDMVTRRKELPFERGIDFTNDLLFSSEEAMPPNPDDAMILHLCKRLPHAARILTTRKRKDKVSYSITDEYDVQDLLHSLIRGYLKYSVQEEPLSKVAGTVSGRADIAIEELGVIIELKYARGPNDQTKLIEDFAKDLLFYAEWPHLKSLIYLIYNSSDLRDPEALEKLSGRKELSGRVFASHIILA